MMVKVFIAGIVLCASIAGATPPSAPARLLLTAPAKVRDCDAALRHVRSHQAELEQVIGMFVARYRVPINLPTVPTDWRRALLDKSEVKPLFAHLSASTERITPKMAFPSPPVCALMLPVVQKGTRVRLIDGEVIVRIDNHVASSVTVRDKGGRILSDRQERAQIRVKATQVRLFVDRQGRIWA